MLRNWRFSLCGSTTVNSSRIPLYLADFPVHKPFSLDIPANRLCLEGTKPEFNPAVRRCMDGRQQKSSRCVITCYLCWIREYLPNLAKGGFISDAGVGRTVEINFKCSNSPPIINLLYAVEASPPNQLVQLIFLTLSREHRSDSFLKMVKRFECDHRQIPAARTSVVSFTADMLMRRPISTVTSLLLHRRIGSSSNQDEIDRETLTTAR